MPTCISTAQTLVKRPSAFRLCRLEQKSAPRFWARAWAQARTNCGSRFWARAFFPHKMALKHPNAFRLRRLARSVGRGFGLRHFTCKFSRKVLFVQCPSAFRFSRLAQSVARGLGLHHFTCKFSHIVAFVNIHVHFD